MGQKTISCGAWVLQVDLEATREAYRKVSLGGADECRCDGCQNFVLVRDEVYDEVTLSFFLEAGIDYRKEAEAYHLGRGPSGKQLYGGWFFLVGRIEAAPERGAKNDSGQLAFRAARPSWPEPFKGLQCVDVSFSAEAPWRLYTPEPDF